jgi:uncharacterized OsmC-like protein
MAVTSRWKGGMVAVVEDPHTGHRLVGDEPPGLGGTDLGPNPFTLLQASLANCTIVTMVGEAELIGAPLEAVTVDVRHTQNKIVGGPRDPEQRTLKITGLRRAITVSGDLDADQVARLLWAAEHCPISNSFVGAIPVESTIELVGEQ